MRLTKRSHVLCERVGLEQFLDRETPRLGVGGATVAKLLIALVQMLRQLLDDLRLAAGISRNPARCGRMCSVHSGMVDSRDEVHGVDEGLPGIALAREHAAAFFVRL